MGMGRAAVEEVVVQDRRAAVALVVVGVWSFLALTCRHWMMHEGSGPVLVGRMLGRGMPRRLVCVWVGCS
jgi:hypothetical protein